MLGDVSLKEKLKWHISYVKCCSNIFCSWREDIKMVQKNRNGKISNDNNQWMLLKLKELDVCKKIEWLLKGICQDIVTLYF